MNDMEMRLQKYLALCGVASRRAAEEIIMSGRVSVNGEKVQSLGSKVNDGDEVRLDGKLIRPEEVKRYILYYKPYGEISSVSDEKGRKTVVDRFSHLKERVYPVGRLDFNTEGLLLLTNDGEFANKLSHPSFEVEKCYLLLMNGFVSDFKLNRLEQGVEIDGYSTANAKVDLIERSEKNTLIEISIHEGRNRQVRKMAEAIGHRALRLKRIAYGCLTLGKLQPGEYRLLQEEEIAQLLQRKQ